MDATFFTNNRAALLDECRDGVMVMTAYASLQLSGDMAAPFRQESHFWYVTGIDEPDWQLIATPTKSWLVAPDISETHRVFDGGLSDQHAKTISGVDTVITKAAAKELLARLASQYTTAYGVGQHPHQKYFNFVANPAPGKLWRQLTRQFATVHDVRRSSSRLRAIKQPVEVAAMTAAIDVTVEAFRTVKSQLASYAHEYEIEADVTHAFRRGNAMHAYDPIVAGGANACTLHYNKNNHRLAPSDLVLLDMGAQSGGYPADITRTYSVGAHPTARQRAVHAAVRDAHQQIIALLRPGLTLTQYQDDVDVIMKDALRRLDLLQVPADYRRYFPHAISHGLGVDVHDSLGGFEAFRPGMVLTVEPGIYIPEEGIGVRLEDDILITESGSKNLSETLSLDL